MSSVQPNAHADLKSPCINLCTMDDKDQFCLGCHRTLEEIAAWGSLSDLDKQEILAAIQERTVK